MDVGDSYLIALWQSCPSTGTNRDHFLQADLNEAARAADASREANGAIYGERLK